MYKSIRLAENVSLTAIVNLVDDSSTQDSQANTVIFTKLNNLTSDELAQLLTLFQSNGYDLTGCLLNCTQQGACTFNLITQKFTCVCNENFAGRSCQVDLRVCSYVACLNNGTCVDQSVKSAGLYACQCPPGYFGVNCENRVGQHVNCSSQGYCRVDRVGRATCVCFVEYYGSNCEYATVFIKVVKYVKLTSIIICAVCITCLVTLVTGNDALNVWLCKKVNKIPKKNNKLTNKQQVQC